MKTMMAVQRTGSFYTKAVGMLLIGVLVLGLGVALATPAAVAQRGGVINIYNWSDYLGDDIIRDFQREYGIRVNYDTYSNNEELHAKLAGGAAGYDLIFPSDYMVELLIEEGLLLPLNKDNLPNLVNIEDRFLDVPYDPDNAYSVPYLWGTAGIGVNTRRVKEPVDSWDILWDPKYSGRIAMLNDPREAFAVALKRMGQSLNSRDEADLQAAKEMLIEQKPLVLTYDADNTEMLLLSEEVWLAHGWSGDVLLAADEDPDIIYVVPKEGATLWVDTMAIPKGARNKEGAELFMNFLLRPDIAARISTATHYPTPNKAAYDHLPEEVLNDPMIYPTDEALANAEWMEDLGDTAPFIDRLWTEIKAQ